MGRSALATIGLVALLSVTAACGGSSTTSAPSPASSTGAAASPSTPETADTTTFQAHAEAICQRYWDITTATSAGPNHQDNSPQGLGAALAEGTDRFDQAVSELRAVPPPADQVAPWATALAGVDTTSAWYRTRIPRLQAGDQSAVDEVYATIGHPVVPGLVGQFEALGLPTCGRLVDDN